MVLISGIYYLMNIKQTISISSFKDLFKTWEGTQSQCLMYGALNGRLCMPYQPVFFVFKKIFIFVFVFVFVLQRLKWSLPATTFTMIYNAIVLLHFNYVESVYDNCTGLENTRLQSLHSKAARILTSSNIRTYRADMTNDLCWMSLQIIPGKGH